MATRRMITSTIWRDEWFGELGYFDQALWIGLFSSCADDQGRFLDNPILIRADVFPYKDVLIDQIIKSLDSFEADGRIIRYEVGGKRLIQIMHWWQHQQPQWAGRSQWPVPTGWIDRIRTRENGQYIEENWKDNPTDPNSAWLNCSGEKPSRTLQPGRQSPVPVPVPVPVPDYGREKAAPEKPDGDGFTPEKEINMLLGSTRRTSQDAERDIKNAGWKIQPDEVRWAVAHFLAASGVLIPFDKQERKDWYKTCRAHLDAYGLEALKKLYPEVVKQLRQDHMVVARPGSLSKVMADLHAREGALSPDYMALGRVKLPADMLAELEASHGAHQQATGPPAA